MIKRFFKSITLIAILISSIPILQTEAIELTPYQKTCTEYQKSKDYLSEHECPWERILCIGDSITEGVQSGIERPFHISYPLIMSSIYQTRVSNYGIGGSTVSYIGEDGGIYPMCERIVNYDTDYDAVFVMGGINDWFYGYMSEIGDLQHPRTFAYDFDSLCRRIDNRYPNADVFIIIPLDTEYHMGIEPYNDIELYRDIERKTASRYGFNIIDLPKEGIMNPQNKRIKEDLFSDACHPNNKGYSCLATILAGRALMIKNGDV